MTREFRPTGNGDMNNTPYRKQTALGAPAGSQILTRSVRTPAQIAPTEMSATLVLEGVAGEYDPEAYYTIVRVDGEGLEHTYIDQRPTIREDGCVVFELGHPWMVDKPHGSGNR